MSDTADRQTLLSSGRGSLTASLIARTFDVPESFILTANAGLEESFELAARPLSQGQMSIVYKATRRSDGERVSLKVLNLSALVQQERAMLKATAEVATLQQLPPNEHIVRLSALACTPVECALVVDRSDFDLLSLVEDRGGRLEEVEAAAILKQVVKAIAHLHTHRWAHRDVKPEHVALTSGDDGALHATLVDFGDAAHCGGDGDDGGGLSGFSGTPLYVAPEVAAWYGIDLEQWISPTGEGLPPTYDFSCDLWSLGATAYVILSGEAPWDQDLELSELVATIQKEEVQLTTPAWSGISSGARSFVRGLLAPLPQRRLSASQALDDPWLLPLPLDEKKPPPAPAPAPAVPPPPQEEEEPPAAAATSALLEAAADELESMRERLRKSRSAERAAEKASEALQLEMEAMKEEAEALEAEVFMAAAMRDADAACLLAEIGHAETSIDDASRRADSLAEAAEEAMHAFSLAEEKLETAVAEALERGRKEGRIEGKAEGLAQGKAEGRSEGLSEGRLEGRGAAEAAAGAEYRQKLDEEVAAHAATREMLKALQAKLAAAEGVPTIEETRTACMALFSAELTKNEEVAAPLRLALGIGSDVIKPFVQPFREEANARDERIATLQSAERELRLELQAKRQRIAAIERTAELAQSQADTVESETTELKNDLHRWRLRCAAVEASLHEAEAQVLQMENEGERREAEASEREKTKAEMSERALKAERTNANLRGEVSLLQASAAEAGERAEAALRAAAARGKAEARLLGVELRKEEGERSKLASELASTPEWPPRGSDMRQFKDWLAQSMLEEKEELERTFEKRVEYAAASAAAAARAAAEEEWKGHLERAVMLTRQEGQPANSLPGPTPERYLAGDGQLALLEDLHGMTRNVQAAARARKQKATPGSARTYDTSTPALQSLADLRNAGLRTALVPSPVARTAPRSVVRGTAAIPGTPEGALSRKRIGLS